MTNAPAPDALKTLAAALAEANGRITQMHAQMIDFFAAYYAVLDDECAPDEKHCTCVPHLRRRIAELEAQLAAVPKWTLVDDNDPDTWPPNDPTLHILRYQARPNYVEARHADEAFAFIWLWDGDYWLPITPPEQQP